MRTAVLAGTLLVACFAQAKTFAAPHVFEQKGRMMGHFSSVTGGQTTLEDVIDPTGAAGVQFHYDKIEIEAFPRGNSSFFDIFTEIAIDEPGAHFADFNVVSPRDPASGLPTGRRMSFFDVFVEQIELPAVQKRQHQPLPFKVSFGWGNCEVTRMRNNPPGTNFRSGYIGDPDFDLLFDSEPVRGAISTSNAVVRRLQFQPEGTKGRYWEFGRMTFLLPYIEAEPFLKAYRDRATGQSTGQRMRYAITDDGNTVLGVEANVDVIGFEDAGFFDFDGFPSMVQVTVAGKKRQHGDVKIYK